MKVRSPVDDAGSTPGKLRVRFRWLEVRTSGETRKVPVELRWRRWRTREGERREEREMVFFY
jgi:hypothetical protein